ncbi:vomeronasal type-1 receptor 4-like [Orycteropus afer afer]|uniref:Vomeronasal type-1 receptor 4-like n=1 Tax=Orycteropus afer afer TaxID=1230840 RepID=A0AC54Z622_ORYAF|nr:vomeronasal type-1 receptor 4-like [Orycteropus afer afer]
MWKQTFKGLEIISVASMDWKFGMIFLFQIIIGMLGNFTLLFHYICLDWSRSKLKTMDSILRNLTVANVLLILSRGIPETVAAFGWRNFLSDFGCKLVFYVHRVARGVSMATTCLLSVFQAITISPRNSKLAELKGKAPKYIDPSNVLCWILYNLINIRVPSYVTGNASNRNITSKRYSLYCSNIAHNSIADSLYAALVSFLDVLCLGLMSWASGSTVLILYRHKQRVQHIHTRNLSPRASPETRATQSILVLVSTFVSIYALSCISSIYFFIFCKPSLLLEPPKPLDAQNRCGPVPKAGRCSFRQWPAGGSAGPSTSGFRASGRCRGLWEGMAGSRLKRPVLASTRFRPPPLRLGFSLTGTGDELPSLRPSQRRDKSLNLELGNPQSSVSSWRVKSELRFAALRAPWGFISNVCERFICTQNSFLPSSCRVFPSGLSGTMKHVGASQEATAETACSSMTSAVCCG